MNLKTFVIIGLLCFASVWGFAQMDTTSFARERLEIKAIVHDPINSANSAASCSDVIMVGAKGDISFTAQELKGARGHEKVVFKSVRPVPGSEIIRIYNATTAVVNWLAAVQLQVDGHDVALKVRRLEVYVKKQGNWCRVAGQGTQVDEQLFPNPK